MLAAIPTGSSCASESAWLGTVAVEVLDRSADLVAEELAGPSATTVTRAFSEDVGRVGDVPPQAVVLDRGGHAFPAVPCPPACRRRAKRLQEVGRRFGSEAACPGGGLLAQVRIKLVAAVVHLAQLTVVGEADHRCPDRGEPILHRCEARRGELELRLEFLDDLPPPTARQAAHRLLHPTLQPLDLGAERHLFLLERVAVAQQLEPTGVSARVRCRRLVRLATSSLSRWTW